MSAVNNTVPALGFAALTPLYDVVVGATTRERTFKSALIEQAGIGPGDRVLDLGCGTGTLAVWIKQRQPNAAVTGLDADPAVLAIAARKAAATQVRLSLDRALSFALPYADGRFDHVVSSLFFHHLSWTDKQRTAAELHRVLRPGGQLHVADWGRASGPVMRAAFVAIRLLDGLAGTRDNVAGRLPELFRDAGFIGVEERRTFATVFGTFSLYRAVKPAWPVDADQRNSETK